MKKNGKVFEQLERSPATWEWPKIAVFVPILPAMPYADEVLPHFFEIARTGVKFIYHPFGSIDSVRNRVAEGILASDDITHVLFLDGDQRHPIDIVPRLAKWLLLKPERQIIGGLYFNRRPPYLPLAWAKSDDGFYYQLHKWEQGLIEGLDLIAAGCMLIDKKVFELVERPWFYHDYEGVQDRKAEFVYPTEDIGFCKKARSAGIEICLDTTINSPHARTSWVSEQTYRTYCEMHPDEQKDIVTYGQYKEPVREAAI